MDTTIVIAGLVVGLLYGTFGVGSAIATPALSLIGIPGLTAVVTPLPALLPSSLAGAWSYARNDNIDHALARRTIAAAAPATVLGALASHRVDGRALLVLSGLTLLLVGLRVLRSDGPADAERAARRRDNPWLVTPAVASVGFASGLLANGGGFLLVPLFLVVLGLDINKATGTSLLIAATLTIPTLATHIALGDIDWPIAALFAAGLTPGALCGGRLAQRLPSDRHRVAFGAILVAFATWYLVREL